MLVREAKEIARQWVAEEAGQAAGFYGAFFHGSINWLAEKDPLPATSDVDVMVVIDRPTPPEKPGKLRYRGVLIEASYLPADQVRTAEQVLGVSHLAGSLRGASLIADPSGQLRAVQAGVSKDYAKREWVTRRCEHAERKVRGHLQALDADRPFHDLAIAWLFGTGVTTHILLAAGLKNPTVRKRYLDVRELLRAYGRADFYETLLELLGCAQMDRARAESHLAALEAAFDDAQAVLRQAPRNAAFPFAADLSELARPVAIDGSRELIERGDQREAVFWLAVTYARCQQVLARVAPPGLFEQHDPDCRALLADLGIRSAADLQMRSRLVLDALPRVWAVAEEIMAKNPEIIP